jgi:hypothetical protein
LLAENLGLQLQAQPIDGLAGTYAKIIGTVLDKDSCYLSGADPLPDWPNISTLIKRKLEIGAGFVHHRYFLNNRERIRKWLWQEPPLTVDPDDILVNVRLGDFLPGTISPLGLVLHHSYYLYLLERLRFKRLYLMTDGPINHPYLNHFAKFSPIIIKGYGSEHFFAALAFNRIIMSNSTFCWWFSFISRATEIYLPMVNGSRCGSWSVGQLPNIDLRLDIPEVTHVYNITNWGAHQCQGPTAEECLNFHTFHKNSRLIFLPNL